MSRAITENYLTEENGCAIVDVSSEKPIGSAGNILNPNVKVISKLIKDVWLTDEYLPQYCVIDMKNMKAKP
jgi:hypothetical protein